MVSKFSGPPATCPTDVRASLPRQNLVCPTSRRDGCKKFKWRILFKNAHWCDSLISNLSLGSNEQQEWLHVTASVPALPCCTHRLWYRARKWRAHVAWRAVGRRLPWDLLRHLTVFSTPSPAERHRRKSDSKLKTNWTGHFSTKPASFC